MKEQKSNAEDQGLKPLLPKSAILRLLSEIVKSYTSCTQLITQHMYTAGQSEIITEVRDGGVCVCDFFYFFLFFFFFFSSSE